MKKILLIFILIIGALPSVNAQSPARVYLPIIQAWNVSKAGLGMSHPHYDQAGELGLWYYNWSYWTGDLETSLRPGYVPYVGRLIDMPNLDPAVYVARNSSGWLLTLNEPDGRDLRTPHLTPDEAAVLWRSFEAATAPDVRLVSPATVDFQADWLWQMVDAYRVRYGTKPRFDAIAWHVYTSNPDEAIAYLAQRREQALARGYDVPFWITEFAGECYANPTGNLEMMTTFVDWMDATPWIGRYAWFAVEIYGTEIWGHGWESCSLLTPGTETWSELGALYLQ